MSRRRNKTDQPDSTAWQSYRPNEANYWFHGGPWVPAVDIPAAKGCCKPENVMPHDKPATRAAYAGKMLDATTAELEKEVALYADLHDRGAEALPWEWQGDRMAKGECKPGEPDHDTGEVRKWANHAWVCPKENGTDAGITCSACMKCLSPGPFPVPPQMRGRGRDGPAPFPESQIVSASAASLG